MTQRTLAALVAALLLLVMLVTAWVVPLPYVVYRPGLTVDVLGSDDEGEIIQVDGHEVHDAEGELRMTTVSVTQPEADVHLFTLLHAWLSPADAVVPWDAVYEEDTTTEENKTQGAVQMVSSQDNATAAALTKLGYDVGRAVEVVAVGDGAPADGVLEVRDLVLAVGGTPVSTPDEAIAQIRETPAGEPVELQIRRDGQEQTVSVTPEDEGGTPRIGATIGVGYTFPFDVKVDIDPAIGGPSAGLMFSLAIYDTLTPGSLTGGAVVAGTGEIGPDGAVGPIGGIQQKIAGADRDGADLFLVPAANCTDALGADNGDMRLVRVETMSQAVDAVETWAEDHTADLPSCEDAA